MLRIVAWLPFLASPWAAPLYGIIQWGLEQIIVKFIYTPIHDEIVLRDVARQNFVNLAEFDKAFLKVKLIEKSPNYDERVKAVEDAHKALDNLALYNRRIYPA